MSLLWVEWSYKMLLCMIINLWYAMTAPLHRSVTCLGGGCSPLTLLQNAHFRWSLSSHIIFTFCVFSSSNNQSLFLLPSFLFLLFYKSFISTSFWKPKSSVFQKDRYPPCHEQPFLALTLVTHRILYTRCKKALALAVASHSQFYNPAAIKNCKTLGMCKILSAISDNDFWLCD